jgi:hypothetical protein
LGLNFVESKCYIGEIHTRAKCRQQFRHTIPNLIGICPVVWKPKHADGLRRIFRPKRDEATGEWRRLHNEELYAPQSSPNNSSDQIKNTEMGRAYSTYGTEKI